MARPIKATCLSRTLYKLALKGSNKLPRTWKALQKKHTGVSYTDVYNCGRLAMEEFGTDSDKHQAITEWVLEVLDSATGNRATRKAELIRNATEKRSRKGESKPKSKTSRKSGKKETSRSRNKDTSSKSKGKKESKYVGAKGMSEEQIALIVKAVLAAM